APSSSVEFIDQLNPWLALASTGYKNRYGHPKQDVVERYLQRGIEFSTTTQYGAMTFLLGKKPQGSTFQAKTSTQAAREGQVSPIIWVDAVRTDHRRFWFSR
ncbi:MAG: hypothetical protein ACC707_15740, partial [Thiohalomonadales bacterium]